MSPDCLPPKIYDSVAAKQRIELFGWYIEWNKRGGGATELRRRLRDAGAAVRSIAVNREEFRLIDDQHVVRYHRGPKGKRPRKIYGPERIRLADGGSVRGTRRSRREIFLRASVITPLRYLQTQPTPRFISTERLHT